MALNFRQKIDLELQRSLASKFSVIEYFWMMFAFRFIYRFKVANVAEIRKRYRQIMNDKNRPVLICSNHLTLIDSVIQALVLNSNFGYLTRPKTFAWNFPERKNYYHKFYWRVLCYFGKCIPVTRGGSPEQSRLARDQMSYVVSKGDVLAIFPEGHRSRSGRVDTQEYSYAPGQFLQQIPGARVLCVYLRGKNHGGFADFPKKGEEIYLEMQVIEPSSELSGMRKARDLSSQIIGKLKEMEEEYFNHAAVGGQ